MERASGVRGAALTALFLLVVLVAACSGRETSGEDTRVPPDSTTDGPGGTVTEDPGRLTVYDLRNPASIDRPSLGADVELRRVVISAIDTFQEVDDDRRRTGNFWVQERNGGEFSGIYVFNGAADEPPLVDMEGFSVGDEVTVRGVYGEAFGRVQITVSSVERTGTATLSPAVVSAADVATGGLLGREYESVLVRVEDVAVVEGNAGFGRFRLTGDLLVGNNLFRRADFPPPTGLVFESVTGVMDFAFDERAILPRTAEDFEDGEVPQGDVYSIESLRDPSNDLRPSSGTPVRVEGAVVTAVDRFREVDDDRVRTGSFFVQSPEGGPYSGIYVFNAGGDRVDVDALAPGDVVTLDGIYEVFFDFDQIAVTAFEVTGQAPVPAPEVVLPADVATGAASARQWESVLVRVEDVEVTNSNAGFGQFQVTDDLRVGNNLYRVPTAQRDVGQAFSRIDGIPVFTFDEHVLMPRSEADVVAGAAPPAESVTIGALRDPDTRPAFGTVVELEGVVVTAVDRYRQPGVTNNRVNQFLVQDQAGGPDSGLFVFNQYRSQSSTWTVDVGDLAVGDVINLRGSFTRFPDNESGRLQLQVQSFERVDSADALVVGDLSLEDFVSGDAAVLGPLEDNLVSIPAFSVTSTASYADGGDVGITDGGVLNNEFMALSTLTEGDSFDGAVGILVRTVSGGVTTFKLLPRSAEDLDGEFLEPTEPTEPTEPSGPEVLTVRALKDPELVSERPAFGAPVRLEGVVVTAVDRFLQPSTGSSNRVNQFWVQDPEGGPWSGIYVFNRFSQGSHAVDLGDLAPGDVVTVEGSFSRFPDDDRGKLQVVVTSFSVTGTAPVPAPVPLDATELGSNDVETLAPWEGQFVVLEDVEVVSDDNLGNFGDLGLDGGGLLHEELFGLADVPVPSSWQQVTGLLDHIAPGSGPRIYKVLPPDAEAMIPAED